MGAIVLVACIVFGLSSSACYPHTVRAYKPGTVTSLEVINSIFDDNDHAVCWLQWTGIPWERLEDGRTLTGAEFTPVRVTQTGTHDFTIEMRYAR